MQEPEPLANETWFNTRWRPAMAWIWGASIVFDFIIFPILNGIAAGLKWFPYMPWDPITLKSGAIYHAAMAGVVGVAVWRRTDEKKAIYDAFAGTDTTEKTVTVTSKDTRDSRAN